MATPNVPSFTRKGLPRQLALVGHVNRDRRRNEHLATVAHEMRNALAPLSCVIDVLSVRACNRDSLPDVIPVARRQIALLAKLTDDLLDLGRAMQFAVEPLEPMVEAMVCTWRVLADTKRQTISLAMPGRSLVRADRLRLGQAIQNVLGNAVKFTPEGGQISVAVETNGTHALVRVTDSGVGISADDLGNVFDLFYRAHRERTSAGGFGIGLALARRIVECHGGSISARSGGLGQGTSFTIALPLATFPVAA